MPFATANFGAIPFRCGNVLRRLDTARTLVMRASILFLIIIEEIPFVKGISFFY